VLTKLVGLLLNALYVCIFVFLKGIVLVSDAAVTAGLKDGNYKIGDLLVEVKDGICVKRGTNTLAGRYVCRWLSLFSPSTFSVQQ